MNIISYNVRGLGRGVKWPAIRRMVRENHIDMLCLQETKKESVDKSMCTALWGIQILAGKHNLRSTRLVAFYVYGMRKVSR